MPRIPLPLASASDESKPYSAQRLLNVMAEAGPQNARSPFRLRTTPGLGVYATIGSGPIHALNYDLPGRLYVVSGTHAWRVPPGSEGVPEDLGEVGTSSTGLVTIAAGPTAVVICVPPNAYTSTHTPGDALNQIGGSFPGGSSVAYIDGYFVFTATGNSSQFFTSLLFQPSQYDALDFAYSDGLPNVTRRIITFLGQLWLLGEAGIQVWYDAGAATFPFLPVAGGVIPYPVASPVSVATLDNSVFFLGMDSVVYRTAGYQAVRVSTHQVEQWIRNAGPTSVAAAYVYNQAGHYFYCLNFVGAQPGSITWCYDTTTKLWHERSSSSNGDGTWLPNCAAMVGNLPVFGTALNGSLFSADPNIPLDNVTLKSWEVRLPPVWADTHRAFMHRVEIECDGGAYLPGDIQLDWSDDGGITWRTPARLLPAGSGRRYVTRLGSFRQRVLRMQGTGPAVLYGADVELSGGQAG